MVPVLTRHGLRSPYRRVSLPDGRTVLRKRVEPHHELTTPPGVAVDEAVLDDAEQQGDWGIVIERARTDDILCASIGRWRRGFPICRGFGSQRGLRWQDLEPVSPRSSQLPLFGGDEP